MHYQRNEVLAEFLRGKQPEGECIKATEQKVTQEQEKAEGWSEILEIGIQ